MHSYAFSNETISDKSVAYTFNKAIMNLNDHPKVQSVQKHVLALEQKGRQEGSWGDPIFKISARNLTGNQISNVMPEVMQGIEFQISQKIAITPLYGTLKKSFAELAASQKHSAQNHKRQLIRDLWINLIITRKLNEEIAILTENLNWTLKNIAISKKLYANGHISQQVLLNVQIRKSEIEIDLEDRKTELEKQKDQLKYLVDLEGNLDFTSVPWNFLETKTQLKNPQDFNEKALEAKLKSNELRLKAAKLAYIPDLTFSFSYTRMLRQKEGFISAGLALPLPLSRKKYASHSLAMFEKEKTIEELLEYKRLREYQKQKLTHDIDKQQSHLRIINQQAIAFAKNSRRITSQSYGFGRSSYQDLMQAELQLQRLLLKRSLIKAQLAKNQISYKYLVGDDLYNSPVNNGGSVND